LTAIFTTVPLDKARSGEFTPQIHDARDKCKTVVDQYKKLAETCNDKVVKKEIVEGVDYLEKMLSDDAMAGSIAIAHALVSEDSSDEDDFSWLI
jgi:hypothetical protein